MLNVYPIAENFHGSTQKNLLNRLRNGCGILKISWRKLSWVAVKLQNLCRFSASKISRYAVCSCVYNTCTCNHRVDDHGACKCTLILSAIPVNLRRPTHVAFILLLLLDG